MRKKILIDPYMFKIDDTEDIKNNINFFNDVINMCSSNKFSIVLYLELYEKIYNRQINPFPINIDVISDLDLKARILILNDSFCRTLASNFEGFDIDQCSGTQDYITEPDLNQDAEYFEMFSIAVSSCYSKITELEPYILVGNIKEGKKDGDSVLVKCLCNEYDFKRTYYWKSPSYFEDKKDIALKKLNQIFSNGEDLLVEVPDLKRADHHCPLQNEPIKKYQDLSRKNKSVLSLLRYFGLDKIILSRFHEDSKYIPGTIVVDKIITSNEKDIVSGWLFCETGFKSYIELYFPLGMGGAICDYTDKELNYTSIEKLKTMYIFNRK